MEAQIDNLCSKHTDRYTIRTSYILILSQRREYTGFKSAEISKAWLIT